MKGKFKINDHDACGTGVIFSKNNTISHSIISRALLSLKNMKHRGALSYDGVTPDGCGMLIDLDRKFYQKKLLEEQNHILPNKFAIAVLMVQEGFDYVEAMSNICSKFDLKIVAERNLNVDKKILGELAQKSCPRFIQFFVSPKKNNLSNNLEPVYFKIKKYLDNSFCTFSTSPMKCSSIILNC
ncbi:hypothetical protein OA493_02435 [Gammaproteobacteria bacterium]|nr:hypothetical protein [Gammaproteobacteria bacterium]